MSAIVVQIKPATVVMTGIEFMSYGNRYLDAVESLSNYSESEQWFDPLPYQLLCQSLELFLKSFIWLSDKHSRKTIKNKYGHNIVKLWNHSKSRGIKKYCVPTNLRNDTIELVGPYYKDRKFAYLDLNMSWEGIPKLSANPKSINILMRLCRQLSKSLDKPVLNAS
ncbi:MAG: hypothetical protein Q8R54_05935 [Methylobacter sp.]|nr:hypothetical protein [Methylobacter sp.]